MTDRPSYHWFEAQLLLWQQEIARRRTLPRSFIGRCGYAMLNRIVARWVRSGRKYPLIFRIWDLLGRIVISRQSGPATARSILLQRLFKRPQTTDTAYHGGYVTLNAITALAMLWAAWMACGTVVESAYILLTYQHNKYTNITVTSHNPNFTSPHLFAVYGYKKLPDGSQEEVFLEIGPSFWFQEYNPEFLFGKISDNAICSFDAYGVLLRIPLGLRYLSKDSLYALNPWIVGVRCFAAK